MQKNIIILLSLICLLTSIDLQSSYQPTKQDIEFKEKSELYKLYNQGKLIFNELVEKILKKHAEHNFDLMKQHLQLKNLTAITQEYLIPNINFLLNSFDLFMTDEFIDKINQFEKKSEWHVAGLIKNNKEKFTLFHNLQMRPYDWPHSIDFKLVMERNGFLYKSQPLKLDRMICDECEAEVYGLLETDIPQYYHKVHCSKKVGIDCDTDCMLKIFQRLRYISINYQKNFPNKSDSEMFEIKRRRFISFSRSFWYLPGWIKFDYYVSTGIYRPEKFIESLFCTF